MIDVLIDSPLLLLFLVVAIGYPLGRVRFLGTSLGVAAVLFVGLAIGALHPALRLPDVVYQLGLVLFVYAMGLSSGAGFFASLRRKGLRDNGIVLGIVVAATLALGALAPRLDVPPALAAGLFTGSLTNTPALAAVLEHLSTYAMPAQREALLAQAVVGYSVAYPMGVLGALVAIALLQRLWKVDYAAESRTQAGGGSPWQRLYNRTVRITQPAAIGVRLGTLREKHDWDVAFGRMRRSGQLELTTGETRFQAGDLVSLVATADALGPVTSFLGEESAEHLELDRTEFDYRRMFVSNPEVVGRRLGDLALQERFGAVVTRVRRGDVEMLAEDDTVLELGDRVRVVTRRTNMEPVAKYFGDSYRALSEIDVLTFSLGLALGSLLGMVPVPLPGGSTFKLGLAGGPLIVGLLLGHLGRTGPFVWSLPYSANLTLRQIGLLFFLAGIGTRSGQSFVATLGRGADGVALVGIALGLTFAVAGATLWIAHRRLGVPMGVAIGLLAGLQTQPAVLAFASEQTGDDRPNTGYASVYPLATIAKILCAQVLVAALR